MSRDNCPERKRLIAEHDELIKQATKDETKKKIDKNLDTALRAHEMNKCHYCDAK